jgi:hypothetical protein
MYDTKTAMLVSEAPCDMRKYDVCSATWQQMDGTHQLHALAALPTSPPPSPFRESKLVEFQKRPGRDATETSQSARRFSLAITSRSLPHQRKLQLIRV